MIADGLSGRAVQARSPVLSSSAGALDPETTPGLGRVVTAFPRTYPLDRIAPAPLNFATALLAEAMQAVSLRCEGWGMAGPLHQYSGILIPA